MAVRRGSRRPKTYDEMCEGIPNYSLFILGKRNPIRAATISLVKGPYFDQFILLLILANCVFLAMDTNEVLFEESSWGKAVSMSEVVFTGIYVVEMILKIIAMGFVLGKGSYLSDPWNRMDFSSSCSDCWRTCRAWETSRGSGRCEYCVRCERSPA